MSLTSPQSIYQILLARSELAEVWVRDSCMSMSSSLWYYDNIAQTLEIYNYIDVYKIWVTLEALFPALYFTTKCCQSATTDVQENIYFVTSNDS